MEYGWSTSAGRQQFGRVIAFAGSQPSWAVRLAVGAGALVMTAIIAVLVIPALVIAIAVFAVASLITAVQGAVRAGLGRSDTGRRNVRVIVRPPL